MVALSPAPHPLVWWQLIESWKKLVRTTAPQPPTPHPTLLATRSPAFDNVCSLCCPQTLVGFFALLKPGSVLQVISAFVVSATFSLLVGVAMPYRDTSDDYFAKACSYALTMLFFFVTVLKMGVLTEQVDSYLTDELRYRFSFDAAFVSGGMIISIVGTLPLAAAIAAHRLLQATRIQEVSFTRTARCSESSAAATDVRQSPEKSGWSRAKEKLAILRLTRSIIRPESRTQVQRTFLPPFLPAPSGPGGVLGRVAEADLTHARGVTGRTQGESPHTAVGESEAVVHAENAPYRQGRPPAATPLEPRSQGKLSAADVEEPPKDRKARLKTRRDEMTADDHLYKDASGTKEGPGRLSRSHCISAGSACSASSSRDSSYGAPTTSNDNEVRV